MRVSGLLLLDGARLTPGRPNSENDLFYMCREACSPWRKLDMGTVGQAWKVNLGLPTEHASRGHAYTCLEAAVKAGLKLFETVELLGSVEHE